MVHLNGHVVKGQDGFDHNRLFIILFVVTQKHGHNVVVGCGGRGRGLVTGGSVKFIIALRALLGTQLVDKTTEGARGPDDLLVFLSATKHRVHRWFRAGRFRFKSEGFSSKYISNTKAYPYVGPVIEQAHGAQRYREADEQRVVARSQA